MGGVSPCGRAGEGRGLCAPILGKGTGARGHEAGRRNDASSAQNAEVASSPFIGVPLVLRSAYRGKGEGNNVKMHKDNGGQFVGSHKGHRPTYKESWLLMTRACYARRTPLQPLIEELLQEEVRQLHADGQLKLFPWQGVDR